MLKDFFTLSLNNLRRRKLRSWLTMIGIFIGIAAVVSLITLGQGLQSAITGQFSTLSVDKLTIQNAGTGFGPPGSTVVTKLNENDLEIIMRVNGVEEAIPRLIRIATVEFNGFSNFNYIGDIPENEKQKQIVYEAGDLSAEKGRMLKSGDRGKVVIGSNIAKKENWDKEIEIGKNIKIQGKEFEVIGILKKGSSFQINDVIMMHTEDMKNLLKIDDEIDLIIVQVQSKEEVESTALRIERVLRKDRGIKEGEEDFSVQTPIQALSTINTVLTSVNVVVVGIALISLFVGGIGIANTMYTSVLERKKEIGTMKAIGARNSDIFNIFLIESGMLGLVGGAIGAGMGICLGYLVSFIANNAFGQEIIKINISYWLIGSAIAFAFLIGVISGLIPSIQASKLNPVDALRG